MKYVSDYGQEIPMHSPQEVLVFRENRSLGKNFKNYGPISPDIAAKLSRIFRVHGYSHEANSLGVLLRASNELLFNYNFKLGYQLIFGIGSFPDGTGPDLQKNAINFAVMVLEAFGWVVTFKEDKNWYYLNFAPLLVLTPEEADREIERQVNEYAHQSLQAINRGLGKNQVEFSYHEIGFGEIPGTLALKVYRRLAELVQPEFEIVYANNYHRITVYTNTP